MAYIEQRRKTGRWYAAHDIPADVRPALGKKRFFQTLRTTDRTTAKARAAALEARWKRQIEDARRAAPHLTDLDTKALYWQGEITGATAEEKAVLLSLIMDDFIEVRDLHDPADQPGHSLSTVPDAPPPPSRRFAAIATGKVVRLDKHLDEYLATLTCESKTAHMRARTIRTFCSEFTFTTDVQKKAVQRWVNAQAEADKAPATIRRALSELRGYWAYLQAIEAVSDETAPFDKVSVPKPTKRNSTGRRTAFTPHDVVRLQAAAVAQGDQTLADLITLAMWTGCRLEELCSLPIDKVGPSAIQIEDAKTPAGWRQVPVHPALRSTLDRLARGRGDGFVLTALTTNKFGDRSNAIGKRFGRLKKGLGFGE